MQAYIFRFIHKINTNETWSVVDLYVTLAIFTLLMWGSKENTGKYTYYRFNNTRLICKFTFENKDELMLIKVVRFMLKHSECLLLDRQGNKKQKSNKSKIDRSLCLRARSCRNNI